MYPSPFCMFLEPLLESIFVTKWLKKPSTPEKTHRRIECKVKIFFFKPSRPIWTAANRLTARRWSHMLDAVISHRENKWDIPGKVGKN